MRQNAKGRNDVPLQTPTIPRGRDERRTADALGDDLLIGIKRIAAYLKQSKRRTQHWHDTKAIPTRKVGGLIIGLKSKLRVHFGADT